MNDSGFGEENETETREPHRRRLDVKGEGDCAGDVGAKAPLQLTDAVIEAVTAARRMVLLQKGEVACAGVQTVGPDVWIERGPDGEMEDVEEGDVAMGGGRYEAMEERAGREVEKRWPVGVKWGREGNSTMEEERAVEEMDDGESVVVLEDLELGVRMEGMGMDVKTEEGTGPDEEMEVGGREEFEDGEEECGKWNEADGCRVLTGGILPEEPSCDAKENGDDVFPGGGSHLRPFLGSVPPVDARARQGEACDCASRPPLSAPDGGAEGGKNLMMNMTEEELSVEGQAGDLGEAKDVVYEAGGCCGTDKERALGSSSRDRQQLCKLGQSEDTGGTRHLDSDDDRKENGGGTYTSDRRSAEVEDKGEGRRTLPFTERPSAKLQDKGRVPDSGGEWLTLRGDDHASCFLHRMKQLRHSEHLTDVLLRCDGGGVLAHRLILTSYSEHLREILEGLPPGRRLAVSLPTVPLEWMEALLDYMYFGHAVLPRIRIPELLGVARELKVESLERALLGEERETPVHDGGGHVKGSTTLPVVEVGASRAEVTQTLLREESMDVIQDVSDELLEGSAAEDTGSEIAGTTASVLSSVIHTSPQCSLTSTKDRHTFPVRLGSPLPSSKSALGIGHSASVCALSVTHTACASSVSDAAYVSSGASTSAPSVTDATHAFSVEGTPCVPFHINKTSTDVEDRSVASVNVCKTSAPSVFGTSSGGDFACTSSIADLTGVSSVVDMILPTSLPDSDLGLSPLTKALVFPVIDELSGSYKSSSCAGITPERRGHGGLEDENYVRDSELIARKRLSHKNVQTELASCNCGKGFVTRVQASTQTDNLEPILEGSVKDGISNDSGTSISVPDPIHLEEGKQTGNQSGQRNEIIKINEGREEFDSKDSKSLGESSAADYCENGSGESNLLDNVLPRTTEEEEIGVLLPPEMKLINVSSDGAAHLGSYPVSEEDVGFYAENLTDLEIEEESVCDGAKTENQAVQESYPEVRGEAEVNKREEGKIEIVTDETSSLFGSAYRSSECHQWPTGLITTNALQQPILNYSWNTVNQDPWHWFRIGKSQEHRDGWDELSSKYRDPEMKHLEQSSGLFEPQMYRYSLSNNYLGALIGRHDPPMQVDFAPYLQGAQDSRYGIIQDAYGEELPSSGLVSQFECKESQENDHDQQDGGSRSNSHGDDVQQQKYEDMLFKETLWNCDQNIEESEIYRVGDCDTDGQGIRDLTDIAIQTFKVDETSSFSGFFEESKVVTHDHSQGRQGSQASSSLLQKKKHQRSTKSEGPRRVSQRSRTMSLRALQWLVDKDLCKTPPKMKRGKKGQSSFEDDGGKQWGIRSAVLLPISSKGRRSARGKKRRTPLGQSWPRASSYDALAVPVTQNGVFTFDPNEFQEQAAASSGGSSMYIKSMSAGDPRLKTNPYISAVKSDISTMKTMEVSVDDPTVLESDFTQKTKSTGLASRSCWSQAQGVHLAEQYSKFRGAGLPPLLTDFSKMDVVQWSQYHGLLAQEVSCPSCGKQMPVQRREELRDGYTFRCHMERTGPTRHDCKRSIRSGSWFARSSLSIRHILQLTYMWALGSSLSNVVRALKITSKSIIDWFCHCRAICEMATVYEGELLGGEGVIVEVRECYLVSAKRKNGQLCNELYLLAGLDVSTGRCFLEKVQERDSATLTAVLLRWVQYGSVVRSRCWEAYDPDGKAASHLSSYRRIKRETINWSDAGTAITSEYLDHFWRFARRIILKGRRDHHHLLPGYLAEAMWRWEHRNESNIFLAFVRCIAKYFNPNECSGGTRPSELRPQSTSLTQPSLIHS